MKMMRFSTGDGRWEMTSRLYARMGLEHALSGLYLMHRITMHVFRRRSAIGPPLRFEQKSSPQPGIKMEQ